MIGARTSSKLFVDLENKYSPKSSLDSSFKKDLRDEKFLFQKITLLLAGFSFLNVWNAILNLNFERTEYYGFNLSGLLVASVGMLFVRVPKKCLPLFAILLAVCSVMFQICHFVFEERPYYISCMVLFFLIGFISGAAQTLSFSIGASLKTNLSGFVSGGFGVSGIYSFLLNLLLDRIVAKPTKHGINNQKVIILIILCEVFLILTAIFTVWALPLKDKEKLADCSTAEDTGPLLPMKEILKDLRKPLINEFVTNFLTLQLFPTVGPMLWKKNHNFSDAMITIIIGMFQVFDFVSKYLPNIVSGNKYFKHLIFSSNTLLIGNALRFLFIGWFVLNATLKGPFFSNNVQLCTCMALMAATHGWFVTLPYVKFVDEMRPEKTARDIERGANAVVIAMFLGLCCGIWSGLLYRVILE